MKWFQYTQNNSGGSFDVDEKVSHHVLIQALNGSQADSLAEAIVGIYFNGVEDGNDCECCGDRWSSCKWDKGTDLPELYGETPKDGAGIRIYPFGAFKPVSVAEALTKSWVIEPS